MAVPNIGVGGGGFQVSPGINVSEIDLTTVVPAVTTTTGAIAGVFRWGPMEKLIRVDSENNLANIFGKPTSNNAETWFTAANFLSYGPTLYVSRAANSTVYSAVANTGAVSTIGLHAVKNETDYINKQASFESGVVYIAKYPGDMGNSLKISVCDAANQFSLAIDLATSPVPGATNTSFTSATTKLAIAVGSNTGTVTLANSAALTGSTPVPHANTVAALFNIGDVLEVGNTSIGKQSLKVVSVSAVTVVNTAGANTGTATFTVGFDQLYKLSTALSSNTVTRYWEYAGQVDKAPGQSSYVASFGNTSAQDEMHVVVVDQDGAFSGNPNTVLEVYKGLSRATDAKTSDNASIYFKNVLNTQSEYVWAASDRSGAVSNTALNVISASTVAPLAISFTQGTDGPDETAILLGDLARAYDFFKSAEAVDISLVLTGRAPTTSSEQLANYIIDNIVEARKDCVVFLSPPKATVVNNASGISQVSTDVVTFRNLVRPSSYAVMDSGYKYQWDKYNDVYRYVPLNGDIAGISGRTDSIADPWFSPAGISRGQVKNLVKLAFNPTKSDRDLLYKNGVNPVVTFAGQGTILYGDKTLLTKTSAFDRINVRRLFIVLEKAIANAAQGTLFEFNDEFTRLQFRNLVEPFLRDVQGRRGIYDFKVVCDDTNNTSEVVDSNRFVGDIYVKPAKSINFIQLNFVAVRSGVEFTEVTGAA